MNYEIEIKSLLGEETKAIRLKDFILERGGIKQTENSQLNHYFIDGDNEKLLLGMKEYFSQEKYSLLEKILKEGSSHSIRTRKMNDNIKLVVKASIDDTTSVNGITRMEFEENVDLTLDKLDQILINAGFEYQAKWSRFREEYLLNDITVCLDKNAGYGWLAEFELLVDSEMDHDQARSKIRNLMNECGVDELDQSRLARMFDHYNSNWRDYYGTDNIFEIE